MNASISATAYLGNAPAPNLSRWYTRYMGDIVLTLNDSASSCYLQLRTAS
jgi:hypothetical protein